MKITFVVLNLLFSPCRWRNGKDNQFFRDQLFEVVVLLKNKRSMKFVKEELRRCSRKLQQIAITSIVLNFLFLFFLFLSLLAGNIEIRETQPTFQKLTSSRCYSTDKWALIEVTKKKKRIIEETFALITRDEFLSMWIFSFSLFGDEIKLQKRVYNFSQVSLLWRITTVKIVENVSMLVEFSFFSARRCNQVTEKRIDFSQIKFFQKLLHF